MKKWSWQRYNVDEDEWKKKENRGSRLSDGDSDGGHYRIPDLAIIIGGSSIGGIIGSSGNNTSSSWCQQ